MSAGHSSETSGEKEVERVPDTGSHEDFSEDAEGPDGHKPPKAQGGRDSERSGKDDGRKEYTGATEAGNEDTGAKM